MRQKISLYIKGMIIGGADVVPGVSGGTMALICGIYEELIASIKRIRCQGFWQSLNFAFFIPLALGIMTAVLLFSRIIHHCMEQYRGLTYALFFGLILASAVFVVRLLPEKKKLGLLLPLTVGIVAAYFFVGMNPIAGKHGIMITFFSGFLAISAMLLPGISGSFLLLILGQYEHIMGAIKSVSSITQGIDGMAWGALFAFGLGVLCGAYVFSHVIHYLLKRYHAQTLTFLVGVMLGALRLPVREMMFDAVPIMQLLIMGVFGAVLVSVLDIASYR